MNLVQPAMRRTLTVVGPVRVVVKNIKGLEGLPLRSILA
jgi:hypothetical protein